MTGFPDDHGPSGMWRPVTISVPSLGRGPWRRCEAFREIWPQRRRPNLQGISNCPPRFQGRVRAQSWWADRRPLNHRRNSCPTSTGRVRSSRDFHRGRGSRPQPDGRRAPLRAAGASRAQKPHQGCRREVSQRRAPPGLGRGVRLGFTLRRRAVRACSRFVGDRESRLGAQRAENLASLRGGFGIAGVDELEGLLVGCADAFPAERGLATSHLGCRRRGRRGIPGTVPHPGRVAAASGEAGLGRARVPGRAVIRVRRSIA